MLIADWTVEYPGQAPRAVTVPHAWGQDVDVRWEGPAVYRTQIQVPLQPHDVVFWGVSYAARVFANGELLGEHRGIWDAFSFSLERFAGQSVEIVVEVVKNGGATYPVKDVASGFLPYVFHTFGGIYQAVELVPAGSVLLERGAAPNRVRIDGTKLFLDGKPWYCRGVLSWGWYQGLGHCNPPDEEIRREITIAKSLGFNLIKFCLWVPSHRYLEIMREEGLEAWIELPLWDPSSDAGKLEAMRAEMERIVRQYAHHDNVVLWTCGCELSEATPPEYRQALVEMVRELTGSGAVKDNSGGAEMYGGDPREFGDFYDYHPYGDTHWYPSVLDSLTNGPRDAKPILLGEFNDYDTHRELHRVLAEGPYWASLDPELNDVGVRWQHDLPGFISKTRFATDPDGSNSAELRKKSICKFNFMRKCVQEAVRARSDFAGYVVTGWIDTPISSAGMLDEWGELKPKLLLETWNGTDATFLNPKRRPPWVNGGNRPGWQDDHNHFAELGALWHIGGHSESGYTGELAWEIEVSKQVVARGSKAVDLAPLESKQLASLWLEPMEIDSPKKGRLRATLGGVTNEWRFNLYPTLPKEWLSTVELHDPNGAFEGMSFGNGGNFVSTRLDAWTIDRFKGGASGVIILLEDATVPCPFWRENIHQSQTPFGDAISEEYGWDALMAVAPDRAIDIDAALAELGEVDDVRHDCLRIDTRTYVERPYLTTIKRGKATLVITTLRPFGGHGSQPFGLSRNPAGAWMLKTMLDEARSGGAA